MSLASQSLSSRTHLRVATAVATAALWAASSGAWAQQVTLLSDDFQAGAINATNFPSTTNAELRSGANFPTQSLFFTGDPAAGTRQATTKNMDFTTGPVTVKFDLRYLSNGTADVGAFDDLDNTPENLFLQYWNGSAWVNHLEFAFNSSTYNTFTQVSTTLPSAALIATGRIRWLQDNYEANEDTWAIDNVLITSTVVPEPGTWALYGLGATGLLAAVRRRRAAAKSTATTTTQA